MQNKKSTNYKFQVKYKKHKKTIFENFPLNFTPTLVLPPQGGGDGRRIYPVLKGRKNGKI